MIRVMDFPEYKKNHPDKTMGDWMKYKAPLILENMKEEYQEVKNQLSESDQLEAEKAIKEYEKEFIK